MTSEPTSTATGSPFVANYPPFAFWRADHTHLVGERLAQEHDPAVPLGLYVHLPFCRRRCEFCFYRVVTGQSAATVKRYVEAVLSELALYAPHPYLRGRMPRFVYFGGGTPSLLSIEQLTRLLEGLQRAVPWDEAEEVAFECEPGTLTAAKLRALRMLGVTRLSLGVQSFDAEVLTGANRAHGTREIERAWADARAAGFAQINLDLIAGMAHETEASWLGTVEQARALAPESVTIYQLDTPPNTVLARRLRNGEPVALPGAEARRRRADAAFRALEGDGYTLGSAYTATRGPAVRFVYRDALWHGADMLGLGVSAFSHLGGLHFQNAADLEPYLTCIERGERPLQRALATSADERLVRELVLQLKLGTVDLARLSAKFGVDVRARFAEPLGRHESAGWLTVAGEQVQLSRDGLLRVDALLPAFFRAEHRTA